MSMKEGMNKWLDTKNQAVKEWVPIIQQLTQDDAVMGLSMKLVDDLESGKIDHMEFLASLVNTTGRSIEEIEKALSGLPLEPIPIKKAEPVKVGPKEYHYHKWLGEQMDNQLFELITRDEHPELPTKLPFVILIDTQNGWSRYLPVNPSNPGWQPILAELEKQQTRRD